MKGDAEKKDGGRELWFEHKLPDGRVYFSHPVTRKTTWDRPPNVQINPHPAQQSTYINTCTLYNLHHTIGSIF